MKKHKNKLKYSEHTYLTQRRLYKKKKKSKNTVHFHHLWYSEGAF